jgi:hypothetical protein
MTMFFAGMYVCGVILSFFIIAPLIMLGGKDSDIWKAFVYPLFWFITIPAMFLGRG